MKKTFFSFGALLMFTSITLANNSVVEKYNESNTAAGHDSGNNVLGRQTCTKTYSDGNGNLVSVSASAGSFLMNDAAAMTKACNKVDRAIGQATKTLTL